MIKQFGDYQILSLLGQGGMGKVYRAINSQGKKCALKIASNKILEQIKESHKTKKRFEREALLAFQLVHPNIVRTFDIGEIDGALYLACELMPKGSLQDTKNFI